MSWHKQHSSFSENPFNKPIIDRCINCGQSKEVKTTITMEFGSDNFHTGPVARIVGSPTTNQKQFKFNHGSGV